MGGSFSRLLPAGRRPPVAFALSICAHRAMCCTSRYAIRLSTQQTNPLRKEINHNNVWAGITVLTNASMLPASTCLLQRFSASFSAFDSSLHVLALTCDAWSVCWAPASSWRKVHPHWERHRLILGFLDLPRPLTMRSRICGFQFAPPTLTYANDVFDVCYRTTREPCDARLDDASDYQ